MNIIIRGLAVALLTGSTFAPVAVRAEDADSVWAEEPQADPSPQREQSGEGESAGDIAKQFRRGKGGFLSTKVIIGVLVAGATAVVVLEAAGDDDSVASSTATSPN